MTNETFFCYSFRLFHYLSAFGEKCHGSKINTYTGNRYWIFDKSERLDKIIEDYNAQKHKFN